MIRRDFLKMAGMAAALGASGLAEAGKGGARLPLGLQLFTVLTALEKDFAGTLAAVAKLGYKEVETIGAFGRDPKEVRRMFDAVGLKSPSQHLVPGNLYDIFRDYSSRTMKVEDLAKIWMEQMSVAKVRPIIEEGAARAHVLGQQYLVWQILWPEQMANKQLLDAFCGAMNEAGKICAREGLTFNFHNHSAEFKPVEGGLVPYDYILANTDPKLVKLEMDSYWFADAGRDAIEYLRRNPGRYVQCHLKDRAKNGDFETVGQGTVDFAAFIAAARKSGVKHWYVEYDRSADPMRASREAAEYLKRWF